ncbi:MAG: GNAT family N-acetyltransferase [Gaiellaceae bacterium]
MEIRRVNYGAPVTQALVGALGAELLGRYDGFDGSDGERAPSAFEPPDGAFLVGWEGEEPVACGGVCRYDETTAELRRMYVRPDARGRGLGRALLGALEDEARGLRYDFLRLETGDRQPEAMGLYVSSGYLPIPRFGPFADDERSVCLEKRLGA